MTTKELLDTISNFFELQQSHYHTNAEMKSNVDLNAVDLAVREAEAREEIAEHGEGYLPFSTDVEEVLSELENQVDTVADFPLEDLGDRSTNEVLDEVKKLIRALKSVVAHALVWNTGEGEESRITFEIYTGDGFFFRLSLTFD